jgi:alpha-mannosidase
MRIPHRGYTRDRLRQTEARIAALVHPEVAPVDRLELSAPVGRIDHAAAQALEYRPVELGADLGPLFATHWLRVAATIPEHWAGARVDLLLDTRSEATLWLDGDRKSVV